MSEGNLRQHLLRLWQLAPVVMEPPVRLDPYLVVDVRAVLENPSADGVAGGLMVAEDATFSPCSRSG